MNISIFSKTSHKTYEGVRSLRVQTTQGMVTILKNHTNIFTTIQGNVILILDKKKEEIHVSQSLLKIDQGDVFILTLDD